MRRGERMMRERYPEYIPRISEFIKTDPIAPARARVLDELRALTGGDAGRAIEDAALAGGGAARAAEGAALARGGAEPSNGARLANAAETLEGAGPLPKKIEALSPGERVWVRGPLALGPRRVLHLAPGWPPFTSGDAATRDAAMAVRAMVRDQGARREVFVYARMTDPDRADGSAVEYVDGGVRVRLVLINGTPRTILSRLGVGGDAVGGDFARFVADVRADVVHVHDLAGESLDLLGVAHVRAIRGALKNVPAFVMGSQSIADRYAAARVLPPSARVHVAPPGMAEDIERVYEEVMKQPRS
jgi:hypothetical protein